MPHKTVKWPSIRNKKDLGVFNPTITAEREQVSCFCRDGSFSLCMRQPYILTGGSGSFCFFFNILILFLFFIHYTFIKTYTYDWNIIAIHKRIPDRWNVHCVSWFK